MSICEGNWGAQSGQGVVPFCESGRGPGGQWGYQMPDLPEGSSFPEQLSETVKIALIISQLPQIALGPINWLTGGRGSIERADDSTEPS